MHSGTSLRPPVSRRLRAASPLHDSARQQLEPALPPSSPPAGQAAPKGVATTSVNIAELKRKSAPELQEIADGYSIENPSGLGKQDLIFRIEQKLLDQNVSLTGEGVLEILPEGYGLPLQSG